MISVFAFVDAPADTLSDIISKIQSSIVSNWDRIALYLFILRSV